MQAPFGNNPENPRKGSYLVTPLPSILYLCAQNFRMPPDLFPPEFLNRNLLLTTLLSFLNQTILATFSQDPLKICHQKNPKLTNLLQKGIGFFPSRLLRFFYIQSAQDLFSKQGGGSQTQGRFHQKKLLFFWILSKLPPPPICTTCTTFFCTPKTPI